MDKAIKRDFKKYPHSERITRKHLLILDKRVDRLEKAKRRRRFR